MWKRRKPPPDATEIKPAEIKLGPLNIVVDGYKFDPGFFSVFEYERGLVQDELNVLAATVVVDTRGLVGPIYQHHEAWVSDDAPDIDADGLAAWLEECRQMDKGLRDTARLGPRPVISMKTTDEGKRITMQIDMAEPSFCEHHFWYEFDRSALRDLIKQIDAVLSRFPVRYWSHS